MVHALCNAVAAVGKDCLGFQTDNIRMHSLRSRAVMSMYLGKCPIHTIMMIGRWSSNTFLLYIQKKTEQFSH
ncbi:hypothetical protein ACHAXS_001797 [Conticribra weissflogii]